MIILRDSQNKSNSKIHLIAIFGKGLVGGSIFDALLNFGAVVESQHALQWGSTKFQEQLDQIFQNILNTLNRHSEQSHDAKSCKISIAWSAGKAGFNSLNQETFHELQDFKKVINAIKSLMTIKTELNCNFHLISSAGGLFEGQMAVNNFSVPHPLRPYGQLKLEQEHELKKLAKELPKLSANIYRLSSVYGRIQKGKRSGLITNLIQNGFLHQVTTISGDLYTLRDYVHSMDVASVVATAVTSSTTSNGSSKINEFFILGNKPTSIYEIKNIVEYFLKHKIYINMQYSPGNSKNITFQHNDLPFGIQPMDIRTGIRDVLKHWHGVNA